MIPARFPALALAAALLAPGATHALCMASGDGCGDEAAGPRFLRPATTTPEPFGIGDRLPESYQRLMNTGYYGLPPVQDGWLYFRVGTRLYRVDRHSREILEDATHEANGAF